MEDLALNSEYENYKDDLERRPTIFKNANNIMFPPPRRLYQVRKKYGNDSSQQQQSANYQRLMKDGVDIYQNMNDEKLKNIKMSI